MARSPSQIPCELGMSSSGAAGVEVCAGVEAGLGKVVVEGEEDGLGEVVEVGAVGDGDGERGGGRKDHEMRDSAIARRTVVEKGRGGEGS